MESNSKNPMISNTTHLVNNNDRLSNLPQHVLHQILSFLDTRDVIRLSVLSKIWRHVWTSMPYITLDNCPFIAGKCKVDFDDFIWFTLSLRDGSDIKRLRLSCETNVGEINKLLFVASRRNIEELDLDTSLDEPFEFPSCLLHCKTLRVLKMHLYYCILKMPTFSGISKLKSLHLEDIKLLDESFCQKLFSNCPLLEDLTLEGCIMKGLKFFEISSSSLKNLNFVNTGEGLYNPVDSFKGELRVSAPNLLFFCYVGHMLDGCSLQNLSSLCSAFIYMLDGSQYEQKDHFLSKMLQGLHNVEVLRLSDLFMECLHTMLYEPGWFPTPFCNLKCLKLCVKSTESHMEWIVYLLKHTPNLKALVIDFEPKLEALISDSEGGFLSKVLQPQEENATCLINHLKMIEMRNFIGRVVELELVKFFLYNGKVLEKMTIIYKNLKKKRKSFEKVLAYPKASSYVVMSFPTCGYRKPFWFEDDIIFGDDHDEYSEQEHDDEDQE